MHLIKDKKEKKKEKKRMYYIYRSFYINILNHLIYRSLKKIVILNLMGH